MKLNFIQNLSDQVVRENHELKAQLQQARQQLKDYEWEMLEVIAAILPQPPLALTPAEIFLQFTALVRQQLADHKQLGQHAEQLREKYEALQKEQLESVNAISQLKLRIEEQGREQSAAVEAMVAREREALEELEWQRECAGRLTEEMSELKMEKLKLEEGKRRAIEEMRHSQSSQLVSFREKNEEEHMRAEKELRREVEMRDRTIKEMSRSLAALTDSASIHNSQQVLTDIFQSFHNYEQLTAANAELKQESQELREEVKALFNRLILIESDLQEGKAAEQNLRSELERCLMLKQEVERDLLARMAEIAKCQRDKEAMEQYYDQKWNSEYKKVKLKLEAASNARLAELERNGRETVAGLQATIRELIHEKQDLAQQLHALTRLHRKGEEEKEALQRAVHSLEEKVEDLNVSSTERTLMSAEEVLTIRVLFHQARANLVATISEREKTIRQQQERMRAFQLQHFNEVSALHLRYESELREQGARFTAEREAMVTKYTLQTASLQKEILSQMESSKSIRSTVENEFNLKLQAEKCLRVRAVAEKEEEAACLNQRWIDKYCQLQSLLAVSRRKWEEEAGFMRNEVNALLEAEYHLHEQRESHMEQIRCLEVQVKTLQTEIQDKRTVISLRDSSIAALKHELALARSEVEVLLDSRKQWKTELLDLQREFTREFESLKKVSEKQVAAGRDKIHELELLNYQKSLTRRELERLQGISSERESFREEMQLKETENIILQQVKDYYQARLRDSQSQFARSDFRTTRTIIARRPKKKRPCNNELPSQRTPESREGVFERRRYAISSVQKEYGLSASKGRLEERRARVQTSTSLG